MGVDRMYLELTYYLVHFAPAMMGIDRSNIDIVRHYGSELGRVLWGTYVKKMVHLVVVHETRLKGQGSKVRE
jgi:hypothetical protein